MKITTEAAADGRASERVRLLAALKELADLGVVADADGLELVATVEFVSQLVPRERWNFYTYDWLDEGRLSAPYWAASLGPEVGGGEWVTIYAIPTLAQALEADAEFAATYAALRSRTDIVLSGVAPGDAL